MQQCQLIVSNKLGLHARAAMKLSDLATRYQCEINILHNDRKLDVKDILKVMTLGAAQGTELNFTFNGCDEEEAMAAINQLFAIQFGEEN